MTIRVAIQHKTTYEFDRFINVSPHILRLRPAPHSRTHIHGYSLKVKPEDHFINWQQDVITSYSIHYTKLYDKSVWLALNQSRQGR